ncbi:FadR/GntR family transcriptional regulator [Phytohabitans kaempferiae]|uniref:FadR/GntR family transcriptional regulator n=1 Tax=Phytohabitans kaempferiae TaxID=1620943 RepID=A0ABV6LUL4_9ACTN
MTWTGLRHEHRPMKTPKYRDAQDKLRTYIVDNRLVAGDRLPPEEELAATFGLSRLSLREAVKGLETIGVLRTVHGEGTFVEPFSFKPIIENLPYAFQLQHRDLRNLLELRAGLEEGLILRASEWIRRRDLADLRRLAESMARAKPGGPELADLDRQFHRRLYEPLDNALVTQMIDLFWEIFHRLRTAETSASPDGPAIAEVHLDIVEALTKQEGVVEAMIRHFDDIRHRLNTGEPG